MYKWIIGIVAVLLFVTPAMAVVITAEPNVVNPCKIEVKYDATSDPNIRAFALDLEVNECNCVFLRVEDWNEDYWVYPGSIYVVDGEVNEVGTPDANGTDFPLPGTLPGLGTQGMTIEMGSLYASNDPCNPNPPAKTGTLFSFVVDMDCIVTISENDARGGIVQEDANSATSNLPIIHPVVDCNTCGVEEECFDGGHPDYEEWKNVVGMPECWCYKYQCYGDADGKQNGSIFTGFSRVREEDLGVLISGWKTEDYVDPETHPWICADFDRTLNGSIFTGYSRIREEDLGILITNWKDDASISMETPNCGGDIDLTP